MKTSLLTFGISLIFQAALFSQAWRSNYYPENWTPPGIEKNFYTDAFLQDFSYAGYRQGLAPIPTITQNIIDVTKAPYNAKNDGTIDVTDIIQAAIDKAGTDGGGVVYLPAGTYKVSTSTRSTALRLNMDNVVLRGEGVGKTFIFNDDINMASKFIIDIGNVGGNWDVRPTTYAKITKDLMGPSTVIPVDKPELFKVGDLVILRNYITADWANEHKEPEWATSSMATNLDGVLHLRTIKDINLQNNTIVIDIPTRYALKTRDDLSVYKVASSMKKEIGVEDLSIGNREVVSSPEEWIVNAGELNNNMHTTAGSGASKCNKSFVINVEKVYNSWIRRVSTYAHPSNVYGTHILSNGILLDQCMNVTIDSVYVGKAQYGGGDGNAYGFRIEGNDNLIKNTTTELLRHGLVFVRMYSHGNVLHNVTDKNTGRCTGNTIGGLKTGSSGSDFHQWFSVSNLLDNITLDKSYYSIVHRRGVATSHNAVTAHSIMWNTVGNNSPGGYAIRSSQTRYGYIIGTSGLTPFVNTKLSEPRHPTDNTITGTPPAFTYDSNGSRTNPEDIAEGVGLGQSLVPQSLYLDQLERRKARLTPNKEVNILSEIKVFPNPSHGGVFTLNTDLEWAIFNIKGEQILKGKGKEINLQNKEKGVYLLKANKQTLRLLHL